MKAPGLGRLCFTLEDKGDYRTIDVRAFWHPHGMPGLFYWLLMIPAHLFIFRGMANESPDWQNKAQINRQNLRYSFMFPIASRGKSRKNAHVIFSTTVD